MDIKAFNLFRFKHFYEQKAFLDLSAEMLAAKPGSIVRVTGPSRSGKSELVKKYIAQYYPPDPNGEYIPAILVEVHNMAAQGRFRTSSLIQDVMDAVKHPILSKYISDADSLLDPGLKDSRISESKYMDILIKALRARKTQVLVLDEPQDIAFAVGGNEAASGILNSWKALASKAKIVIVLVGAYPILDVLDLSAHMTGRTKTVHLKRYKENEEDLPYFLSVLDAISKHAPVANESDSFVEWAELMMKGSLGCIGLLTSWVASAGSRMNVSGQKAITKDLLLETMLCEDDREVLLKEMVPGETRLAKKDSSSKMDAKQETPEPSPVKVSKRKRKPGKQNPRRHKGGSRG